MDQGSCLRWLLLVFLAFGYTDAATVRVYAFEWTINPLTLRQGAESDVRVRVNVTSSRQSDNLGKGKGLWRVGIFGSQNRLGHGPKYDYRPQILDRKEQGRGIRRGKKLIMDVETKFNLRGLGPNSAFPYMCVEFTHGDAPRPPFVLLVNRTNSIVSCQRTPEEQDGEHDGNGIPLRNNAIFSGIGWMVQSPRVINPTTATPVRIILIVGISPSSDSIQGRNLWKASLYASHNRDGSGQRYFLRDQIFSEIDQSRSLDNSASNMTFDIFTEIEYYGINCRLDDPRYLCVAFARGENDNYNFPLYGDEGIRNCQEIQCKVDGSSGARPGGSGHDRGTGRPQVMLTSLGWSTERYIADRYNPTRIDMRITAMPSHRSDTVSGSGLWEVKVFGSEHPDGSGSRFHQKRNILSRQQMSEPMYPGRQLTFDVGFDFMMGLIGCHGVNYLCVELSKGTRVSVDFDFSAEPSCKEIPCPFSETNTARLTNIEFSAQSSSSSAPRGLVNMDITATLTSHRDSDRISGTGLWRVGVFGSQRMDGTGRKRNEMRNILTDSMSSRTLIPGRDLVLSGNANLNLQGIGRGQDYPYLCMEFAKGDSPKPDFELPMRTGQIVSCTRDIQGTPVASGNPVAVFERFGAHHIPGRYNPRDGRTRMTFEATLTPSANSDDISGSYLWRMGAYGSENEDGTGRKFPVSDQLLRPPATNQRLVPGQVMEFRVTDNVDIRTIGPGTGYPYLCIEFGKTEYASPDFDVAFGSRETVATCQLLQEHDHGSHGGDHGTGGGTGGGRGPGEGHGQGGSRGQGGGHGRPDRPLRALVSSFSYEMSTAVAPRPDSHLTDVEITTRITPFDSTDTIQGTNLWRVGFWGSRYPDGHGSRMAPVRQILSASESSKTLQRGQILTVEGSARADLRGIGGSEFPYFCVEFGTASDDPFFSFPVNPGPTLFTCRLFTPVGGRGDPDMPRVIFSRFSAEIIPSAIPGSHLTQLEISATVIPHDRTNYVPDAEFRLGFFGNRMSDGSGPRVNEIPQLLPPDMRTHPVYAGRDVEVDVTAEVDMRGMGTGTNYPFLCLEFDKRDDYVEFDMPMNTASGTFITCYQFSAPAGGGNLPTVQVTNMRNNLEFSPVPGSDLVEVTITSIITPGVDSDHIPTGNTANWRLGIYGSDNQLGTGPRWNEVSQLLPWDQQRLEMYPRRIVQLEATEELDLSGMGPGTSYPYLCIEFGKAPGNNNFNFPQETVKVCDEFTPPAGGGNLPTLQVTNMRNNLEFSPVPGSDLVEVTITSIITPGVDSDHIPTSNTANWRLGIYGSDNQLGTGPRWNEVSQLLPWDQQRLEMYPRRIVQFEATEELDLSGMGPGTSYPFLCIEFGKAPGNNNINFPQETVKVCDEFTPPETDGGPYPEPSSYPEPDLQVTVTEVLTERKVKAKEKATNQLTFDVVVKVDPSSDQVDGSNLWVLTVWASKSKTGSGPRHGEVLQVLSPQQQEQTIENRKKIPFRDVSMKLDLNGVKCSNAKYLCSEISQGSNPDFTLVAPMIGCEKLKCKKKGKKDKKPSGQTTLAIRSIEPSRLSIFEDRQSIARFTAAVEFDASQSEPLTAGGQFWQLSGWFNSAPDASNKYAKVEQLLNVNKRNKYVTDVTQTFGFGEIEFSPNLRGLNCDQLRYFCVKLTQDDPSPPFNLVKAVDNANLGCSRTTCR